MASAARTLLLLIAGAAALESAAARQLLQSGGCPTSICNSYFSNAMGGPVDCCNHDYSKNPKCSWGGTPVSFTQPRTCSADGKTYSVLIQGNFQGPPTTAECRCQNPVVASKPGDVQMPVTMKAADGQDIKGSDLSCDNQSFCKVCGGVDKVAAACGSKAKCVAFTYEPYSSCGYLKAATGPTSQRGGWMVYSRA